jgi:membrane protease subunit HflC
MRRTSLLIGAAIAVIVVGVSSVYVVDERQQALVLQFGQVVHTRNTPGIGFKLPFIQNVVKYDDRILSLETTPLEVTPLDDRRLVVDAFARWRITNPVQFRQAVGSEDAANVRLERILNAALRQELGSVTSNTLLSADRSALMARIRDVARTQARGLGVEIVDVRIKRADLPAQNLEATFGRMQAERQREAADERARGQEAAQVIRAQADRTAVETVSEARKKSEIVRGEADALRNRIFAEAFGRDPEFFAFYRSLTAYERALLGKNSSLVISPDSAFFDYFLREGALPGADLAVPVVPDATGVPGEAPDPAAPAVPVPPEGAAFPPPPTAPQLSAVPEPAPATP